MKFQSDPPKILILEFDLISIFISSNEVGGIESKIF